MTRAPAVFLIAIVFAIGLAWRSHAAERGPDLTLTGTLAGATRAEMGDALPAAAGTAVEVLAHVAGAPPGAVLSLAGDAAPLARLADPALGGPEARKRFSLIADGKAHWLRVDVRDAKGQLILIGSPIYLRPGS